MFVTKSANPVTVHYLIGHLMLNCRYWAADSYRCRLSWTLLLLPLVVPQAFQKLLLLAVVRDCWPLKCLKKLIHFSCDRAYSWMAVDKRRFFYTHPLEIFSMSSQVVTNGCRPYQRWRKHHQRQRITEQGTSRVDTFLPQLPPVFL